MSTEPSIQVPDWPDQPESVQVAVTLREGGVSRPPWNSLNMGVHVGDDPQAVAANRQRVMSRLSLPSEPVWLNQMHGTQVACIETPGQPVQGEADAAYTRCAGVPLCILTADCLPVLITDRDGQEVGAAHAGWRSLCHGVLENLLQQFSASPQHLLAWLGPAIGPQQFEVGPEVKAAFVEQAAEAESAFTPGDGDRWLADIYQLARQRLARAGVTRVAGGGFCTVTERAQYFSYRRDGQTGRMAALIWRQASAAG
ncbi:MAG: peptidoglycan editing factor PgeF [Natronospirillum sp.]|uniref:peptidoglycan editing factor PgeF n=1 Tax=Natronospirillum sp. TaxID=2812955 RepID=UPI0025FCA140|nr:peptidoglycan editing factor PgeF [Natronospirillum sp.]MCH8551140.1 peptidoglycan editing factor PgeF [Natronospirillum sp.]